MAKAKQDVEIERAQRRIERLLEEIFTEHALRHESLMQRVQNSLEADEQRRRHAAELEAVLNPKR
jgi:hypothetical protein